MNSQPGMVVQIPTILPTSTVSPQHLVQAPSPAQGGMVYIHPVGFQPSPGSPGTGLLLGVSQSEPSKEVGPVAVSTMGGGADLGGSGSTDAITKLMQMQSVSAFHQPSSQVPVSTFPDQAQQHQQAVGIPPPLAGHTHPAVSNSLHEQQQQQQQPSAVTTAPNTQLPHPTIPVPALATMERSEALLPIPPVISSVPPITASAPGHLQSSVNTRKEILCRYFIAGQCPYGEKCWFAHPEPVGMPQIPQRDFSSLPHTSIPTSPLRIQVPQHQIWNPNLSNIPLEMATGGYVASPPQSPMSAQLSSAAPSGIRPPILPPYPFPNQPPLIFWQSPGRGPRNFPLLPTLRPPLTSIPMEPMLRFVLLAEVMVQPDELDSALSRNISQLTSRADHFYVGFEDQVRDYKILFSGQHSYQESWTLQDRFAFLHKVTCLHCSRQQPYLLVVGTEAGQVFTCILRKGNHFTHSSSSTSLVCTLEVSGLATKTSCVLYRPPGGGEEGGA